MHSKTRFVFAISVAAVGLALSPSLYAAPAGIHAPIHAMFAKSKMVKLSLRNDSTSPMELKVGENVMTIEAGKTVAVKVAVGTRILANAATSLHKSGELLAEVSPGLNDATLSIK